MFIFCLEKGYKLDLCKNTTKSLSPKHIDRFAMQERLKVPNYGFYRCELCIYATERALIVAASCSVYLWTCPMSTLSLMARLLNCS
jgi:hypothetical protein